MNPEPMPTRSFPLRIPTSTHQQAAARARLDGVSLNYFVIVAITERIARLQRQKAAAGPYAQGHATGTYGLS
jgi:hypothetical protein